MTIRNLPLTCVILPILAGCASITVTNSSTHPGAKGVRYSLPKPVLQATPQADGTVTMDVMYLPDDSNTYAINTSSQGSSYTFQITRTQNRLLAAIEYKEDTSAVGQQLIATVGTVGSQVLNIQNAQLMAAQTSVNTAQTAVDSAKTAADAAAAQLQADTDNGVTAKLNDDKAAVAQAQAKLQDAQAVLDRAKNTAQAVTITASAGTPVTTSGPTAGTGFAAAQPWSAPTVYDLPTQMGSVIYAINDSIDPKTKVETVSLVSQKFPAQGDGPGEAKQQVFATTTVAEGAPTIGPQGLTYELAKGSVKFVFSREVKTIEGSQITTADNKGIIAPVVKLGDDFKTVTQDITGLKAGSYVLTVSFTDDLGKPRVLPVKFTLS